MKKIVIVFICFFTVVTVACSSLPPTDLPPTIDIKNTEQSSIADDIEKQSASYHHFLIGNIALINQDFDVALENLKKSSELSGGKSSTIHAKLAELYLREGLLEKSLDEINKAIKEKPKKIDNYYVKAGLHEALSQVDEAKKTYEYILKQSPNQKNAYLLLANIYREDGDTGKSKKLLEEMIKRFPNEIISYQYLAKIYEKEKETAKAEAILKKAYEQNTQNEMLAMEFCRLLILQGKLSEAKIIAMKVIEKNPNHSLARRILAELSLQDENLDEALAHFNALKDSQDDTEEIRYKIALIYMQKNMPEKAEKELNLLLASTPNHVGARYALGTVYVAQKKYKEAITELEKIEYEDDKRNYIDSKLLLAYVYKKISQDREACNVLEDAYENVPEDKQVVNALIAIYRRLEKNTECEKVILTYLDKHPGDIDMLFQYAVLQYEEGKKEEAFDKIEHILKKDPDYADALNYIAYSLAEDGENLSRATEYINRALKKDPKNPYYIDTLGWIKFKQKEYKEALDLLLKALNLTNDDIVIFEHIGDVYMAEDEKELAKKYYEQALKKKTDKLSKDELNSIERVEKKLEDL